MTFVLRWVYKITQMACLLTLCNSAQTTKAVIPTVRVIHSRPACRAMVALMQAGDAESAAILTPYNGQVRLIRRILKEHTGELYSKVCQSLHHYSHS